MSQAITPQAAEADNGLLSFIERASRDPEFDVGKFEALLRMQREIVQEQERREFNRAMREAQTRMAPIVRDATNTHTKSKYAKLETIDREIRPIYTEAGFSLRFGSAPSPREGWLRIVCTVSHVSGYSETNYLDAPPDDSGAKGVTNKTPVQAVGSSVSYLRRYLTTMVFNIVLADDDDDGQTMTGRRQTQRPYPGGNGTQKPPDDLDEPNGTVWLRNLAARLRGAQALSDVVELRGDPRVRAVVEGDKTPTLIKAQIEGLFSKAHERLAAAAEDAAEAKVAEPGPPDDWSDPIAELIAEAEEMDLIALNGLASNAAWRAKVRDAADFPPDEDRLNEAIAARRAALQGRL